MWGPFTFFRGLADILASSSGAPLSKRDTVDDGTQTPKLLRALLDVKAAMPIVLIGVLLHANDNDGAIDTLVDWRTTKAYLYLDSIIKYLTACLLRASLEKHARSSAGMHDDGDFSNFPESPLSSVQSDYSDDSDEESTSIADSSRHNQANSPSATHTTSNSKSAAAMARAAVPTATTLAAVSLKLSSPDASRKDLRETTLLTMLKQIKASLSPTVNLEKMFIYENGDAQSALKSGGRSTLVSVSLADAMALMEEHRWVAAVDALEHIISCYDAFFSSVLTQVEHKSPDNLLLLSLFLRLGHWMELSATNNSTIGHPPVDKGVLNTGVNIQSNDDKFVRKRRKVIIGDTEDAFMDTSPTLMKDQKIKINDSNNEANSENEEEDSEDKLLLQTDLADVDPQGLIKALRQRVRELHQHRRIVEQDNTIIRQQCQEQQMQINGMNSVLIMCKDRMDGAEQQQQSLAATLTARETTLDGLLEETAKLKNDNERLTSLLNIIELEKAKVTSAGTYTLDLNPVKASTEITVFAQELDKYSRKLLVAHRPAMKSIVIPAIVQSLQEAHPNAVGAITLNNFRQNHVSKYISSRIYQILVASIAINPITDMAEEMRRQASTWFAVEGLGPITDVNANDTQTPANGIDALRKDLSADMYYMTHEMTRRLFTMAAAGSKHFRSAWNTYFSRTEQAVVTDLQCLGLALGSAPGDPGNTQVAQLQGLIVKFAETYFLLKAVDINWQISFPSTGSFVDEDSMTVDLLISRDDGSDTTSPTGSMGEKDSDAITLYDEKPATRMITAVAFAFAPQMHISGVKRDDMLVKANVVGMRIQVPLRKTTTDAHSGSSKVSLVEKTFSESVITAHDSSIINSAPVISQVTTYERRQQIDDEIMTDISYTQYRTNSVETVKIMDTNDTIYIDRHDTTQAHLFRHNTSMSHTDMSMTGASPIRPSMIKSHFGENNSIPYMTTERAHDSHTSSILLQHQGNDDVADMPISIDMLASTGIDSSWSSSSLFLDMTPSLDLLSSITSDEPISGTVPSFSATKSKHK